MIKLKDFLEIATTDFDVHCPENDICLLFNTHGIGDGLSKKEHKKIIEHYADYKIIEIKNNMIKIGL